jgi:hypothetical protein
MSQSKSSHARYILCQYTSTVLECHKIRNILCFVTYITLKCTIFCNIGLFCNVRVFRNAGGHFVCGFHYVGIGQITILLPNGPIEYKLMHAILWAKE